LLLYATKPAAVLPADEVRGTAVSGDTPHSLVRI